MGARALSAAEKRQIARRVGGDLIRHYGKKRCYTVPEVKKAAQRQELAFDWYCWAYALYTDRAAFDEYHREIGEICEYRAMHQSMMGAVGGDAALMLEVLDPSPSMHGIETADDSWSMFDFFDWSDGDVDP